LFGAHSAEKPTRTTQKSREVKYLRIKKFQAQLSNKMSGQIYLSHCLSVHDAMIHSETIKTNKTVPGHIVIRVLKTNLGGKGRERELRVRIGRDQAQKSALTEY
jgi:hypothetical protein